jgi:hypothetical protein
MTSHSRLLSFIICVVLISATVPAAWSETRSTPVSIVPTGNTVQIANPISIDPAGNTVGAPTLHSAFRLCETDTTIPNGSGTGFSVMSCTGYKEIRIIVSLNSIPVDPSKVIIQVSYFGFAGAVNLLGTASFAATGQPITSQASFKMQPTNCAFTLPVMFDSFYLGVMNTSGGPITINGNTSVIYLVN